jgi:hypothetical protein
MGRVEKRETCVREKTHSNSKKKKKKDENEYLQDTLDRHLHHQMLYTGLRY